MTYESEKIILGAMLLRYNQEHISGFSAEDFPYCGDVFKAVQELHKKGRRVDPVAVSNSSGVFVSESVADDKPVPARLL